MQTAAALSYAHGRGIVHRDIKPGNLILDTTGNVWVTDFGLAKTGDGGVTHTGDILGTVRYMSPERFRGQCDVRADVYALGMTLYELLTLKAAYASGDRLRLIELIRQAEAASPRSVDSRIPLDLETVVMKAIDKDPKRRYQSADEMAEDLQRFVNDEPIRARRVGPAERFGRWCRRHPGVAGLTAAVLVLMAAGTAVSTWQAVVATRAREDLAAKHAELAAEQAKVEAQNRELAAEQAKVQARFDTAVKAIETFHTGVSADMLLKNPEFKELRKKLLNEAARFYAELERLMAGQTDPKSRKTLADGYFQLAELTGKIGDMGQTLDLHRKALAIRRELAAAADVDVETRLDVGRSLWMMGCQLMFANPVEAWALFEEQRDLTARLAAVAPTDPARVVPARGVYPPAAADETIATADAVRALLGHAHHCIGNTLRSEGKFPEAQASYRRALAVYQKLADADPANVGHRHSLAGSYDGLGVALAQAGKTAEGVESFRKASAVLEKLAAGYPDNIEIQQYLVFGYNNRGVALMSVSRPTEALECFQKVSAVQQKLTAAHPAVTLYKLMGAYNNHNTATALMLTGKPDEALKEFRDGIAILTKLAGADPTNSGYQGDLAGFHQSLAGLHLRQGRPTEVTAALERSVAIAQKQADAYPAIPRYTLLLAEGHGLRGRAHARAGHPAEAVADLRRALGLWEKGKAAEPDTLFERSRALALLAGLGGDAKTGVTKDEAKAFADQSVAGLADAIAAGWAYPNELKEPEFDAVRGRADFQKLVAEVEAKAEKVPGTAPPPREKK